MDTMAGPATGLASHFFRELPQRIVAPGHLICCFREGLVRGSKNDG